MQTVAEEKRKAYRCVCWSSEPVGPETLQVREEQKEGNVEGERERMREREREEGEHTNRGKITASLLILNIQSIREE
jgi:hypothetical protein